MGQFAPTSLVYFHCLEDNLSSFPLLVLIAWSKLFPCRGEAGRGHSLSLVSAPPCTKEISKIDERLDAARILVLTLGMGREWMADALYPEEGVGMTDAF
jgi:hypothetical protein